MLVARLCLVTPIQEALPPQAAMTVGKLIKSLCPCGLEPASMIEDLRSLLYTYFKSLHKNSSQKYRIRL
ncbi:hypothetical protein CRI93_05395 [Longimonas halophila]|uniref:Uncharacterized protein n=1 Tax=Longimonas halophila TaxID=1469170 RepID=A0A2H3P6C8_9BACT|nr:hypothetical protein CRI93_05395 [Longimonas halophila]